MAGLLEFETHTQKMPFYKGNGENREFFFAKPCNLFLKVKFCLLKQRKTNNIINSFNPYIYAQLSIAILTQGISKAEIV